MKVLVVLLICLGINTIIQAQEFTDIQLNIDWATHGGGQIKGDLNQGIKLEDLSWAWSSSIACFPGTQSSKFTGNHVLYSFDIPSHTEVEIQVIPENPKDNFSLYAYMIGAGNKSLVPQLRSCIRCESDYKWDRPVRGKVQDHRRVVRNILALKNPYTVIIGVVGAEGLQEGAYTLQIKKL
jgi:hypothetical protein